MNDDSLQPAPERAPQMVRVALPQSAPYVTYSILAVTIVVYVLQLASKAFLQFDLPVGLLAKSNDLIRDGQLWRLFTPALVHGGIAHIGFNMYALLAFGVGLERAFGHGRLLLLYVLGAFAGNVMSFLFTDAASVGASTAIFGLIGAELVFLIQNRKLFAHQFQSAIGNVIFIIFVNLFMGLAPSIDNWGHIGGLVGGLMFTSFAGPLWDVEGIPPLLQLVDRRESREVFTGAAVTATIFVALAVWGMAR
ncbi:MAG: rhomboid family intramembrane serine protease [Anaerolineales bacterium]|nr:rhomboid family intramembrane serine protease [Anaerolineales bacterium]